MCPDEIKLSQSTTVSSPHMELQTDHDSKNTECELLCRGLLLPYPTARFPQDCSRPYSPSAPRELPL